MKTFKILFITLAMTLVTGTFISCTDNDGEELILEQNKKLSTDSAEINKDEIKDTDV